MVHEGGVGDADGLSGGAGGLGPVDVAVLFRDGRAQELRAGDLDIGAAEDGEVEPVGGSEGGVGVEAGLLEAGPVEGNGLCGVPEDSRSLVELSGGDGFGVQPLGLFELEEAGEAGRAVPAHEAGPGAFRDGPDELWVPVHPMGSGGMVTMKTLTMSR